MLKNAYGTCCATCPFFLKINVSYRDKNIFLLSDRKCLLNNEIQTYVLYPTATC